MGFLEGFFKAGGDIYAEKAIREADKDKMRAEYIERRNYQKDVDAAKYELDRKLELEKAEMAAKRMASRYSADTGEQITRSLSYGADESTSSIVPGAIDSASPASSEEMAGPGFQDFNLDGQPIADTSYMTQEGSSGEVRMPTTTSKYTPNQQETLRSLAMAGDEKSYNDAVIKFSSDNENYSRMMAQEGVKSKYRKEEGDAAEERKYPSMDFMNDVVNEANDSGNLVLKNNFKNKTKEQISRDISSYNEKFEEKHGEFLAKTDNAITNLDRMMELTAESNFTFGRAGANVQKFFGDKDVGELDGLKGSAVLDALGGSLGAQISNSDRQIIENTTLNWNDRESTIKLLAAIKRAMMTKREYITEQQAFANFNGGSTNGYQKVWDSYMAHKNSTGEVTNYTDWLAENRDSFVDEDGTLDLNALKEYKASFSKSNKGSPQADKPKSTSVIPEGWTVEEEE